jgi:hypothetical protein
VCDSLTDLPVDRLETEKAILRTEAAGRARGAREKLALWRYGAQGYGLMSYHEWGVGQLRAEDVRYWAQTWFTRDNAVLWLAGDGVPNGLRLRLPAGTRRPVPAHRSLLREIPAYFASGSGQVVLDTIVRRSTAASVFSKVLERQLFRSLRQEGGYSYTATTSYAPRGDGFATITALADALPDKQDAVLGGIIDVLAQLKAGRIDQQDIDAVRAQSMVALSDPDADAERVPGHAINLLTGQRNQPIDELRTELRAITGQDIHAIAVEAIDSVLLQVPRGRSAAWAGFAQAPPHSSYTVIGTRYAFHEDNDVSLVVGADGASLVTPAGPVTVRFTDARRCFAGPTGRAG